jgi:uncharacterized membrane protein YoaK (UPF0700 family)
MSGLIDAVSILGLGRVFVANMTGNIVFIGFALAHVPGFSLMASLAALVGFLIGAFLGASSWSSSPGTEDSCCVMHAPFSSCCSRPHSRLCCHRLACPASGCGSTVATAMGIQNTAARRLAVPDLTTTVLTMTLTGIAADSGRNSGLTTTRRALAVLTMLLGALGRRASCAAHRIGFGTGRRTVSAWPGRGSRRLP